MRLDVNGDRKDVRTLVFCSCSAVAVDANAMSSTGNSFSRKRYNKMSSVEVLRLEAYEWLFLFMSYLNLLFHYLDPCHEAQEPHQLLIKFTLRIGKDVRHLL